MESVIKKFREFLSEQEDSYREVQSLFDTQVQHMETIPEMPLEESTYREVQDYELEYLIDNAKSNENKLINAYKDQLIQLADDLKNSQSDLIEASAEILELKDLLSKSKAEEVKIESLTKSLAKERGEKASLAQKNDSLKKSLAEKEALIAELSPDGSTITKSSTKYSDASFSSGRSNNKDGAMMELVKYLQKKDDEVDRLRQEIAKIKQTKIPPKKPSLPTTSPHFYKKATSKWKSDSLYSH